MTAAYENTRLEPRVIDFIDLLKELNDQQTLDELNEAFTSLLKAVRERSGKGTLTYTLTVDPVWLEDGVEVRFEFADKIALKLPDKARAKEFLFAGRGTSLYTSNPYQPDPDESAAMDELFDNELFENTTISITANNAGTEEKE